MTDDKAHEADAFLQKKTTRGKKSRLRSFLEFLYDKENGKVLGRTGKSWFQITLFYIVFYALLAAFFAVCLAVFLEYVIKEDKPVWFGKGTIIGVNPGLGYHPWLRSDPESTLVYINVSDPESYTKYLDHLNKEFLIKYEDNNNTKPCTHDEQADYDKGISCRVRYDDIKQFCAGDGDKNKWGYDKGEPCVFLTLNRLIDWVPVTYPDGSVPDVLKGPNRYLEGNVGVNCEGEYAADEDNVGDMEYNPAWGFDKKFFPYRKMSNYHSPIVAVKFKNIRTGVLVMVECKAYAYNIIHDRTDKLGMVHFEMLIDRENRKGV